MPKQDTMQEQRDEAISGGVIRPVGLSFSSFFYAASGLYYLIYPIVIQDTKLYPLYIIGALSIVGSVGIMRVTRWGLWVGLALFALRLEERGVGMACCSWMVRMLGRHMEEM